MFCTHLNSHRIVDAAVEAWDILGSVIPKERPMYTQIQTSYHNPTKYPTGAKMKNHDSNGPDPSKANSAGKFANFRRYLVLAVILSGYPVQIETTYNVDVNIKVSVKAVVGPLSGPKIKQNLQADANTRLQ